MRKDVLEFLQSEEDYLKFLRQQPKWYRKLSRNPELTDEFRLASLEFFGKTIPQRVDKLSNQVQMASFMIDMFHVLKDQHSTSSESSDTESKED
ncbi:YlbE-like family protein [Gottfriedia acidiceleris]|uniref:YlbE-like family protein n=1 Tax=Gottfriedia acidiceleris TaxID=371036 RepID=A0ABY4JJI4_9BACI|nr:YlbE-like family protein [Gottfriedia acidiceleris]UPM53170.1 YlbE-like family protein [Gottfriedia acidiceleris]